MLPTPDRRTFLIALAALGGSACFGKFGATFSLYDWNVGVSDNKWLRWLVFLLLIVVPVYVLFAIADILVINTLEFFSGNNPVSGGHVKLKNGHSLASTRTSDPNVIRHEHRQHGKLVQVVYVRRVGDEEMHLCDAAGHIIARARLAPGGAVELYDGAGKLLRTVTPDEQQRIGALVGTGAAPSEAFAEAVPAQRVA